MSDRVARWFGIAIAITVLGLTALGQIVALRAGSADQEFLILLALILVGVIGSVLVAKRPANPVSWLLASAGLIGAIAGLVAAAEPDTVDTLTSWQMAALLIGGPTWFGFLLVVLVLIPLLFPTGRYLSPRWRWVGRASVSAVVAISALWVLQEEFCIEETEGGCLRSIRNPIGISGVENPEQGFIGSVLFGVFLVCLLAAMASLVVRYLRSRDIERQQLKWLAFAISLFVIEVVLVETLWVDVLGNEMSDLYYEVSDLLWVAIPASIAIAVLRYRLYDIDRLISRTVSYAVLAGLLGVVFAGGAVWLPARLAGGQSPLFVAASTLVVAALFNPLRSRVQTLVDRRFNRSRFDAERVIEGFAGSLRERVDPEVVVAGWVGVVRDTMQPSRVTVWLRQE